ncbi:MAG: UbiA family prenyltransferase [Mobilitalea sp.]
MSEEQSSEYKREGRTNTLISKFLDYVEIRTKITSVFAFLYSIAFLVYQEQKINWILTLLFFISMFVFDLTTTAINNYIDTKNNQQMLQFNRKSALLIIYVLFGISCIAGLYLAYRTDVIILLVGGICFLCGILYTYGPLPISRQPLGEVLSGIFYGLLIPFILLYINMPKGTFLLLDYSFQEISIKLQVVPIVSLLLFSIIPFCTTANIMLANNICDLEKDILVKRHTLPYYIGRKALYLFAGLYYMTYIVLVGLVAFKILSPICLFALLTIIIVQRNINKFFQKQDKSSTFVLSVKNYIIIMGADVFMIFVSALFN